MAPFLAKTFKTRFKEVIEDYEYHTGMKANIGEEMMVMVRNVNNTHITNNIQKDLFIRLYNKALQKTIKELKQASEGLIHNLNTLESRPGCIVQKN